MLHLRGRVLLFQCVIYSGIFAKNVLVSTLNSVKMQRVTTHICASELFIRILYPLFEVRDCISLAFVGILTRHNHKTVYNRIACVSGKQNPMRGTEVFVLPFLYARTQIRAFWRGRSAWFDVVCISLFHNNRRCVWLDATSAEYRYLSCFMTLDAL